LEDVGSEFCRSTSGLNVLLCVFESTR